MVSDAFERNANETSALLEKLNQRADILFAAYGLDINEYDQAPDMTGTLHAFVRTGLYLASPAENAEARRLKAEDTLQYFDPANPEAFWRGSGPFLSAENKPKFVYPLMTAKNITAKDAPLGDVDLDHIGQGFEELAVMFERFAEAHKEAAQLAADVRTLADAFRWQPAPAPEEDPGDKPAREV